MTTVTPTLEFFDAENTVWRDISADMLSARWSGGIRGGGPTDRVAVPRSLTVEIDNSAANSVGQLGAYSPDHANCRDGWAIGAKLRIKLVSGGNTRYWLYRVRDVKPVAGMYGTRRVEVTARDYIAELSERKVSGLQIQNDKTGGQLVPLLVARLPFAPTATSYGTGVFTYPWAFHDERSESTYAMTVLQKICQSDLSYCYVDGDATGGETLTWQPHTTRMNNATAAASFSDTMTDLEVMHSHNNVWNSILCNTYPVEVGQGDTPVVLGSISQEFALYPGESRTITIPYLDPDTEQRISGNRLAPLTADTDYKMSSYPGNGGNDLNASLSITPTEGANSLSAVVQNTGATIGYVNRLQVRGFVIKTKEKVGSVAEDSTSITTYGEKSLTFNMPYQSLSQFGDAVANEILRRYKDPSSTINGISFIANKNTTLMGYALTCGISSRIDITETVTGIDTAFFINGYDYELQPGAVLRVTWTLERAFNFSNYFTIDDNTLGVLDSVYLLAPF